jgi:hypothetical protein
MTSIRASSLGAGGLFEDEQGRLVVEGVGQPDPLPPTTGQPDPSFTVLGLEAFRELALHKGADLRSFGDASNLLHVNLGRTHPKGDVSGLCIIEEENFLGYISNPYPLAV